MSIADTTPKTPWHLWLIGGVTLLWNGIGAFDFLMTVTQNEGYMAHFTQEQLDYFYGFPTWAVITWGIAVIGGLLGSLLLLMRRGLAVPVLIVSLIAMIVVTLQNHVLSDVRISDIMGPEAMIMSVVIFVVTVLLVWYAWYQRYLGVLR